MAGGAKPKAGEAQLASFSLFSTKDPFVQKIVDHAGDPTKPATNAPAAGGGAPAKGGSSGAAPKPPAVIYGFATHLGERRG